MRLWRRGLVETSQQCTLRLTSHSNSSGVFLEQDPTSMGIDAVTRTIVVAYDGTLFTQHALRRALDLAGAFGAKLIVADLDPDYAGRSLPSFGSGIPDLVVEESLVSETERDLQFARARSLVECRGIVWEVVSPPWPIARGLVDVARQHGADLIVITRHEPRGLARLLAASLSIAVARDAHCDVLVIHS